MDAKKSTTLPSNRAQKKLTHRRDVFHAWMLKDLNFSSPWELPTLKKTTAHPKALVPFSLAMRNDWTDFNCFVHFFEDDYLFERVWNNPNHYLEKLKKFDGVIMPDFSTCGDFPKPLKMYNAYRNQLLAAWFQKNGLTTLPNARIQHDCEWLIEAIPQGGTIAICGRCLIKNVTERRKFIRDIKTTVDTLKPSKIVYYGSDSYGVMDYPRSIGIPILHYPGNQLGMLNGGKSGQRK